MTNVIFLGVALLSVCFVFVIASRKGVMLLGETNKLYKPCDTEEIVPFKGIKLILMIIACFAIFFAAQFSLYKNTEIISFVKLYSLLVIVITAGIIDFKRKIIPNILIIIGFVIRVAVYIWEIISVEEIKNVFINDLIGFAIGFVLLAFISIVTKGALGFGDAKLFGVIGITAGSFCTYSTLLVSLVFSTVAAIVNLARKKMGRKDSIPFGPCIALGYILVLFLNSY